VAGAVPTAAATTVLPQLKPISPKPFPEGVSEATVCEAIDSKEPDLWVRFGHLVPAYITGAVYVLETGPENKDKLFKYISSKYVYGYYSQQASCRGELTLLYIRKMFDKSEFRGKPFGRDHLSQAIEKKFGIKTRESFQLNNDEQRLAAYCRADVQLCESLIKLDLANEGQGLCPEVLGFVGVFSQDSDYATHLATCRSLPLSEIGCAEFGYHLDPGPESASARESCRDILRNSLRIKR
jgi:hypothetical protein